MAACCTGFYRRDDLRGLVLPGRGDRRRWLALTLKTARLVQSSGLHLCSDAVAWVRPRDGQQTLQHESAHLPARKTESLD